MTEIIQHIKLILISFGNIFRVIFRNWHIRKTINLSNLFKLFFIYIFSIVWIISFEIEYSKQFWSKLVQGTISDKRFSLYGTMDRIGEGVLYDRMLIVADKEGYDYSAFKFSEALSQFWLTAHFYYTSTSIVNYIFKPNFNLAITHHVNILPKGYNITYLNMPLHAIFDKNGNFLKQWQHLNEYNAYIDLYSFVNGNNELLQNIVKTANSPKSIIALYFAHSSDEYEQLPMNKALITGSLWGCNRDSLRFAMALKKLVSEELLVGIGLKDYLGFLGKAYLGAMEDFGNVLKVMREQQQKYGIALIAHNQEHMLDGIPTSRISEAAASGALIISDYNYFLVKFFGDNVLYFDAFASSEQIYLQIKEHVEWARNNPEKAHLKTKKAYQIFIDNFTIEKQFNKLFEIIQNSSVNII